MKNIIHTALDLVMLLEIAAGAIYLGAVLADWVLDRLIRCIHLHCEVNAFLWQRARERHRKAESESEVSQ